MTCPIGGIRGSAAAHLHSVTTRATIQTYCANPIVCVCVCVCVCGPGLIHDPPYNGALVEVLLIRGSRSSELRDPLRQTRLPL